MLLCLGIERHGRIGMGRMCFLGIIKSGMIVKAIFRKR